jgi:hypothetical protein
MRSKLRTESRWIEVQRDKQETSRWFDIGSRFYVARSGKQTNESLADLYYFPRQCVLTRSPIKGIFAYIELLAIDDFGLAEAALMLREPRTNNIVRP